LEIRVPRYYLRMKTSSDKPDISIASLENIRLLMSWAELEGWNPGLEDAQMFFTADRTGFYVKSLDGKPIAGVSVVKQNDEHAFLGLYLCESSHRGAGHGLQVWTAALESSGTRSVGLDGVVDQQENYKRSGFAYLHRNIRYSGVLMDTNQAEEDVDYTVRKASIDDLEIISSYDASIGGLKRHAFFNAWFSPNTTRCLFYAERNSQAIGIVGLRQCINGYKLGPWLADDSSIAMTLLAKASQTIAGEQVMIDVPEPNQAAVQLVKKMGLEPSFETARMYRGAQPPIDALRLFGVATLELG